MKVRESFWNCHQAELEVLLFETAPEGTPWDDIRYKARFFLQNMRSGLREESDVSQGPKQAEGEVSHDRLPRLQAKH